ncbi:hypothetical protein HK103_005283 [Boothiomyces macroporosus]|uniref:Uncharacterized protein n=1 Tax=Boothiomyces macroporosus TaxID=261099 RepID=A0AAD5Y7U8_9FUNG|nr:hypothetical protein HK103_000320 [Boothiomyces macroporosus]KAJ3256540.1 hypothetical protein HK103_005283 [Boothiomyces macroporosus]
MRRKSNLWDSLLPAAKEQVKIIEEEDSHVFAERNLSIQRNLEMLEKKSVQGVLGMKIKDLSLAKVRVDVIGIGPNNTEYWIGGTLFHVHDIIRVYMFNKGSPSSAEYAINGQKTIVGQIGLEITFNYGALGYGVSPQVPHPPFIPFKEKVYLSYGIEYQDKLEKIADNLYKPKTFIDSAEKISKIRDKYFENPDRANRLIFLHDYLSTNHQRQETVTFPQDQVPVSQKNPEKDYIRFLSPVLPDDLEFLTDKRNNRQKGAILSAFGDEQVKRDRKMSNVEKSIFLKI